MLRTALAFAALGSCRVAPAMPPLDGGASALGPGAWLESAPLRELAAHPQHCQCQCWHQWQLASDAFRAAHARAYAGGAYGGAITVVGLGKAFKSDDGFDQPRQRQQPLTCQPREREPLLPIFHIIGNVTGQQGSLNIESINDVSSILLHKGEMSPQQWWAYCCRPCR